VEAEKERVLGQRKVESIQLQAEKMCFEAHFPIQAEQKVGARQLLKSMRIV
jgi:hypothetical protein